MTEGFKSYTPTTILATLRVIETRPSERQSDILTTIRQSHIRISGVALPQQQHHCEPFLLVKGFSPKRPVSLMVRSESYHYAPFNLVTLRSRAITLMGFILTLITCSNPLLLKEHLVGEVGLEPTKPKGGRFTVSCNCHYATPPSRREFKVYHTHNLKTGNKVLNHKV